MKTTCFALLLAIVLTACAPAATPAPTATAIPQPTVEVQDKSAQVDSIFEEATKAGTFSGSILIAQNGQVILSQGYGFADREKKTPNTPTTKFRIGQLTWGFTAMAILLLQEQGKLNVQDKMCTYVTDCPDSWKPITLHQLLTHDSGIPDATWYSQSLDKMIAEAKTQPLGFQPGSASGYINTGYVLLGKIIEAASGQSYEAFLQKNFFEPLQMSSTGYDQNQADLALGYPYASVYTSAQAVHLLDPQALYAAGALYSTVEDLYRWDQALYTDKLVSQKALDTMFTGNVHAPDYPVGWQEGYGYAISPSRPRLIEGFGYINGFTSAIHRWPDDNIFIVILTNQQDVSAWDKAGMVDRELFGR